MFENVYIPYGCYWSTPFCRWQGSFSHLHSLRFAADIARRALKQREVPEEEIEELCLGFTIPQQSSFYGAPWVAGMIGLKDITGPTVSQACATSAKAVALSSFQVEKGDRGCILVLTCDRTSNSPHLYYPNPLATGGIGEKEDWVWDNFGNDPYAENSMIQTAENVAKEVGIDRESQDEVSLIRYEQYQKSLQNDSKFHRKFMVIPIDIMDPSGKKKISTVNEDEGIYPSTREGLAKLKPVLPGGTVTYGTQTYPADGSAAILITDGDKSLRLSRDKKVRIRLVSCGQARAKKGFMAMAIVPAARRALSIAGISIKDCKVIKTHNPFAVNDIYFCKEFGLKFESMNNYGSPLIWGHPQGPTGCRAVIEMIEELVELGGGYGIFDGCAAGDSAFCLVLKVE